MKDRTNRDFISNGQQVLQSIFDAMPTFTYGDSKKIDWGGESEELRWVRSPRNVSYSHLEAMTNHFERRGLTLPVHAKELLSQKHYWDTVEAVRVTDETAEMMDLEVEEDHSFIAEGVVVHNSQGSTLDTGYVDWRDLTFRSEGQQTPLLYVAVTRPAKRLALLV